MNGEGKKKDQLPDEFADIDQAGEFWDTHDVTDYVDDLEPVDFEVTLKKRHFEVEVDEELLKKLKEHASKAGVSVGQLVRQYLREKFKTAA